MTGGRVEADVDPSPTEPVATASKLAPRTSFADDLPTEQSVSPSTLKQRLILADVVAIGFGLVLAFAWQSLVQSDNKLGEQRLHVALAFITFPAWLVAMSLNKLYLARAVARPTEEFRRIVNASLVSVGFMVTVAFAIQFKALSRLWVLAVLVFVPVLLVVERTIARRIFMKMRRRGKLCRPILIVGTDDDAVALMEATRRHPELGYRVVGFVGTRDGDERDDCDVLGDIADTEGVLEATGATGVLISLASIEPEVVNVLTRRLTDNGYHVALTSGLHDIDVVRFRAQDLAGRTLIYVEQIRRDGWRGAAKRVFDISFAVLGLLLSAPLTIVAAVAIKVTSPGPIIFSQERVGRDGETFRIFKFRTMVVGADARKAELAEHNEADGPMFKITNDPRITRAGRLLRRLSIDEIPQFFNVLRGDMSVVGPRPALASEVEQWSKDVHERLRVLPGITGMWQISGRSDTTFDEYKRLDLYYVDNWSLAHDLRIVARTFSVVLARDGAR